jgi:hypothetical protein
MNAQRRKEIAKARGFLEEAKAIIETAASEERDYYDNMPESFQNGEKGEKASEAADKLEEIDSSLDEAIGSLTDLEEV